MSFRHAEVGPVVPSAGSKVAVVRGPTSSPIHDNRLLRRPLRTVNDACAAHPTQIGLDHAICPLAWVTRT